MCEVVGQLGIVVKLLVNFVVPIALLICWQMGPLDNSLCVF